MDIKCSLCLSLLGMRHDCLFHIKKKRQLDEMQPKNNHLFVIRLTLLTHVNVAVGRLKLFVPFFCFNICLHKKLSIIISIKKIYI